MKPSLFDNQHAWGSVVVDVDQMPRFQLLNGEDPVSQLQDYFVQFIRHHNSTASQCFILPSLSDISKFLNVTPDMMIQALKVLRTMGYDNMAGGMYGHVTVWKPSGFAFTDPF